MSDALQHECGIALVRLLKPLEFYKEKYGLLSTEYKNVSLKAQPWTRWCWFCKYKTWWNQGRYISQCVQSCSTNSRCFFQINDRINEEMAAHLNMRIMCASKSKYYVGIVLGTCSLRNIWKNSIECSSFYVRTTGCTEPDFSWNFND
jgi:amidophosphoribosyltransferase